MEPCLSSLDDDEYCAFLHEHISSNFLLAFELSRLFSKETLTELVLLCNPGELDRNQQTFAFLTVTEEQRSVVSVTDALVGCRHRHWSVFCMDVSFSKSAVPL